MSTTPKWIKELIVNIAACNGLINRHEPESKITEQLDKITGKMPALDVVALEVWLGSLSYRKLNILVDGEEEEMAALVATSPTLESGKKVGQIIEEIWEEIE